MTLRLLYQNRRKLGGTHPTIEERSKRLCDLPISPRRDYNTQMTYRCLAEFLDELGQSGELVRIETPVDPILEAAEIANRLTRAGGPAVLFGAPNGHEVPLVANLLGTEKRICRVLDVSSLDDACQAISELVSPRKPTGWVERIKPGASISALDGLLPKSVRTAACQQVVRLGSDVDLGELPVPQSLPEESVRTITAGQVFTAGRDSPSPHVGRYDIRFVDRDRMAVRWHDHQGPARQLAEYRLQDKRMPVAVVLGGDPAGLLAAMTGHVSESDVLALGGYLRRKPWELVACRTVAMSVAADAEIVIEGYIDPSEPAVEIGTVCTPSGHYTAVDPQSVIHVTAVTHRTNPVFPAMAAGSPPTEETVVTRSLQRIFLPLVQMAVPELVDYDLPDFAAARHLAFVSIRKTNVGQTRSVAGRLWGLAPLMCTRVLVIVDEDVDVRDSAAVWAAVSLNTDPDADVFFQQGAPDPLDPAAGPGPLVRMMAVDATVKLPGERQTPAPRPATMDEEIQRLVSSRWEGYGLG